MNIQFRNRAFVGSTLAAALLGATLVIPPSKADPAHAEAGPSFDCRRASLPDEKAVCADPRLAKIDRLIAEAYAGFEPEFGDKRRIGRQLAEGRRVCGADPACVIAAQMDALNTYGSLPDWVVFYARELLDRKMADLVRTAPKGANQPKPRFVGQCAVTSISALLTRFSDPLEGADPDAGSMVELANGVIGVSYTREPQLAGSKVGQPVVTCLTSIPRDCPEEDERGRFYYTRNIATGQLWNLPDAEHLCGGA